MSFLKFSPSDNILLLGEGNFSFSSNYLQIITDHEDIFESISVIATCFESNTEDFSEEKVKNINFLKSKGASVLCGVDVNNLEQHFIKGTHVFSKVIFNFPHVGGKMKIHLNRSLLKNIFCNLSDFISNDSELFITLCDGQGGTEADTKVRRYDDTWQVVEMAAISSFILKFVEPFPLELFPNYCSVGFRGWEKGFHVENSLIHVFQLGNRMDISSLKKDLIQLFSYGQIESNFGIISCPKLYSDLHSLNLFTRPNSPFNFLSEELIQVSKRRNPEEKTCLLPDNACSLHVPYTDGTISFLGQEKIKLRSCLLKVMEAGLDSVKFDSEESLLIYKGQVFNDLTECLDKSPIEGEIVLLGRDSLECAVEFLNSVKEQLKSEKKFDMIKESNDLGEIFLSEESSAEKILVAKWLKIFCHKKSVLTCIIRCDSLIRALLKINHWQEIWSENLLLKPHCLSISRPSVYPLTFKFDVNFLVSPSFDIHEYYKLLWSLTHIAVTNTELISEYVPPDNKSKKFLCYRIYYKSFRHPLCKSVALEFHQNIVCGAIVAVLNAVVC